MSIEKLASVLTYENITSAFSWLNKGVNLITSGKEIYDECNKQSEERSIGKIAVEAVSIGLTTVEMRCGLGNKKSDREFGRDIRKIQVPVGVVKDIAEGKAPADVVVSLS